MLSVTLDQVILDEIRSSTAQLANALSVVGLLNIQFAIKREGPHFHVYVLEVNPRASRTVPFVSKSVGIPLARIAAKAMAGISLDDQNLKDIPTVNHVSVKESVFPFARFPGVDIILGPEMRSTGEVMGADDTFAMAFAKSQMAAGVPLPQEGTIFVSVRDRDKIAVTPIIKQFSELGYRIMATAGTAERLLEQDIDVELVHKLHQGRPNLLDHLMNGQVQMIINTPKLLPSRVLMQFCVHAKHSCPAPCR